MQNRKHQEHGAQQKLVGDGIEVLAQRGLLFQSAREQAIETRSSNEASSIPHRDTPSGLSESNTPQNFSRGLPSVSTTMVRGWNGFSTRTNDASRSPRFFTKRLSPEKTELCN